MPRFIAVALVGLVSIGCDGGEAKPGDSKAAAVKEAAEKEAAAKAAATAKAEKAEKAQAAEKEREAAEQLAYDAAKGSLEPLAKLPKKHPKGFATACVEMLAAYDTFMKNGLAGDELAQWTQGQKRREMVMRRACHQRPVRVVVCENAVLKKAPRGADFEHIMRVCSEKFDVPG